MKTCHDLLKMWHDFGWISMPILVEEYSENKGYDLRRAKCDFET